MNGCFVVLMVWSHIRRCKEGKSRRDIWSCTTGESVDTTSDTLVDFGATFEVWVFGIGVGGGIDRVSRALGRHDKSSVELVDAKALTNKFGEGRLT